MKIYGFIERIETWKELAVYAAGLKRYFESFGLDVKLLHSAENDHLIIRVTDEMQEFQIQYLYRRGKNTGTKKYYFVEDRHDQYSVWFSLNTPKLKDGNDA